MKERQCEVIRCELDELTLAILERYQRHLFHYRKPNGEPLTFGSQQTMLVPLKSFFQWAARDRHIDRALANLLAGQVNRGQR